MLDKWGTDFLRAILEVNKHTDGFVDGYFGPPEIKEAVNAGDLIPIDKLRGQLNDLRDGFDDDDAQRKAFVFANLKAAETALRLDKDETLTYEDEVRLLFGIEPDLVDESKFKDALAQLDEALPGQGTISERLKAYIDHYELSDEHLETAIQMGLAETRQRTAEMVDMVDGEGFVYAVVSDKSWGAYNWYQGNAQSLIEFNTDIPVNALGILNLCAHEGYPGHHTENMLKEQRYYKEGHRAEHALVLLLSPMAVIAEGIATTAQEIIFPDNSADDWLDNVFFPAINMKPHPADVRHAVRDARKNLGYVSRNVAYLHNTGQLSYDDAIQYVMTHTASSERRASQTLRFVTERLTRAYIFTYTVGYDLIANAKVDDKVALFKRLLTEPMLPADLVAMG